MEALAAPLRRLLLAAATIGVSASGGLVSLAEAHVLDEYLQATLVVIEPDNIRLKINLTPGVEVADQVLAALDGDRNGAISEAEAAAYAQKLERDLTVHLDGQSRALKRVSLIMPEVAELRTGHGLIQMEFAVQPASLARGSHRLKLENRHFPAVGSYLFNAARPRSRSIHITSQERSPNQSRGEIEFVYDAPLTSSSTAMAASALLLLAAALAIGWRLTKR